MLISHRHAFAFIHVPKTGGTSVARALWSSADHPDGYWANRWLARIGIHVNHYAPVPQRKFRPHVSAEILRRNLPAGMFESLFTFAFVRNPWDLLVSYYHFLRAGEQSACHYSHRRHVASRFADFEAYVRYEMRRDKLCQARMVTDRRGRVIVDFLGRYESLTTDFTTVCSRIGVPAALGRANASTRGDYRAYYNDRLVADVRDHYAEDVELFGYEFDEPARRTCDPGPAAGAPAAA